MTDVERMEVNSYILCQLGERDVPHWVRPRHIWEERWDYGNYTAKMAIEEAKKKIEFFEPRREGG